MSFLGDLLEGVFGEAAASSVGSASDRGRVRVWLCVGIVLLAASGWLLTSSPEPLREPPWGLGVLAATLVFAPVLAVLCVVHGQRMPNDRLIAVPGAIANAGASLLAIVSLL
jgi:hypothetical protein